MPKDSIGCSRCNETFSAGFDYRMHFDKHLDEWYNSENKQEYIQKTTNMKFDTNVDLILGINKKTHDVIMSCTNMTQLSGAKQFVKLAKRFYDNVICVDDMQKSYIAKAIDNIDKVLKIKSIKLKSL